MEKAYYSANVFENFAIELNSTLNYIDSNKEIITDVKNHSFFDNRSKRKDILTYKDYNSLELSYSLVEQLWESGISFSKWIHLIQQYSQFIRIVEKCFFYKNESSIDDKKYDTVIYSELREDKSEVIYFRFLKNNYKFRIIFKESMIEDLNLKEFVTERNLLKEYINDSYNSNIEQYITFVNILIQRDFGKQVCNEFNFIDNEDPIYKDETDKVLIDTVRRIISYSIKENYEDICNNYIIKSYKHTNISDFKNILKGKLYAERI